MDRALANLNETLRVCRLVTMLDESNLFLVYVSLALEFWCQDNKTKRRIASDEFNDHSKIYLRLVNILMIRLKILITKNGLQSVVDELHRGILNWRTYHTMNKMKSKKKNSKDMKITVLTKGKVMVNLN